MFMMTNYKDFLSSNNVEILVVSLCLFAGIIVGNVHVLVAFWQNRGLRNQGRCHIVSLAVADLLVGLLLLPIRTYQLYYLQNPFHAIFCVFYMWIDTLCETASIVSLTVISIDRCYKITFPLQYKAKVTPRKCFVVILGVWFFSTTFATLGVIPYNGNNNIHPGLIKCFNPNYLFYLFAFIFAFVLPCVILTSTYVLIFITAYRRRRRLAQSNGIFCSAGGRSMYVKDLKNAKTLAIFVLAFIICWGPIFLAFGSTDVANVICKNVIFCFLTKDVLPFANSLCNPIIYALCNREFRQAVQKTYTKFFRRCKNCF